MQHPSKSREYIAAEAIDWFLHLQNLEPHTTDPEEFSEWLMRSPAHIEEFLAIATVWAGMKRRPQDAESRVDALIEAARSSNTSNVVLFERADGAQLRSSALKRGSSPKRWRAAGVMAASLLLCVVAWFAHEATSQRLSFRTAVGEQRSVALPDGSIVSLNTNSEIHATLSRARRDVELVRGEARFQVTKDPNRPFVVATAEATVRAVGTIFNVRANAATTEVAVMEGRVEVKERAADATGLAPEVSGEVATSRGASGMRRGPAAAAPRIASGNAGPDSARIELSAGERAAVTRSGIQPNVGPSIDRVTAWTERRLVFRGEPLSNVVAEFNRYRVTPLVLDDARLAALEISGVFDSGDPHSLIEYLSAFEAVSVMRLDDGSVHLSRQ
jgi:transmembrane sensor